MARGCAGRHALAPSEGSKDGVPRRSPDADGAAPGVSFLLLSQPLWDRPRISAYEPKMTGGEPFVALKRALLRDPRRPEAEDGLESGRLPVAPTATPRASGRKRASTCL